MSLPNFPSAWMTEEHRMLQDSVRRYMADKWVPHAAQYRAAGKMGPDVWREAGANGLLCGSTPVEYVGGGGDFGHEAVILLEQLPQERLIIAVSGIRAMERALDETLKYTKDRLAFGKRLWDFQNTRFKLAEVQAVVLAARAFVDACMVAHLKGELAAARAALVCVFQAIVDAISG